MEDKGSEKASELKAPPKAKKGASKKKKAEETKEVSQMRMQSQRTRTIGMGESVARRPSWSALPLRATLSGSHPSAHFLVFSFTFI